jgi:hypothetical protein
MLGAGLKVSQPTVRSRAQDLPLGQLIFDLRTDTGLSQREFAARWAPPSP